MVNNSSKPVKSVAEYLDIINKVIKNDIGTFVFRGQSDSSYPVNSSASRRISFNRKITSPKIEFVEYNKQLIDKAKMKGYHQKGTVELKDLELLAELQHNGAATCLIDFTGSPLIALFFACYSLSNQDGAVYVTNIHDTNHFRQITSDNLSDGIEDLLDYTVRKPLVWEPSDINSRIPKQHSIFIFGELEIHENCFITKILIDKESKPKISEELKKSHNLDVMSLFSDLPGFAKANPYNKPYILSSSALLEKGKLALDKSNYRLAQHFFEQIENSNDPTPHILLETAKTNLRDYEGAIKECDILIKNYPDIPSYYVTRGNAKCRQQKFLEAIKDYDIAIKLEDDYYEAATKDGISLEPEMDDGESYYCRGRAKLSLGDYDGARKDLLQANSFNYDYRMCNKYISLNESNREAERLAQEQFIIDNWDEEWDY